MVTENTLASLERDKVSDFLSGALEHVATVEVPSGKEMIRRRLAIKHIKSLIRTFLSKGGVSLSQEDEWRGLAALADNLLLENFTRQVPESDQVSYVHRAAVKDHNYVTVSPDSERRTYMGLHRRPFDNNGLSVVSAFKPSLHVQPFHAHRMTGENTLAIHPTTGRAFLNSGAPSVLSSASGGEMFNFAPYTPHTLQNPGYHTSVDISIKVPDALDDRVNLNPRTIEDYLKHNSDRAMFASMVVPELELTGPNGSFERIFVINEGVFRYAVHYVYLMDGENYEFKRFEPIMGRTLELAQVFAPVDQGGGQS